MLPVARFEEGGAVAGVGGVWVAGARRLVTTAVAAAEVCPAPEALALFVIFARDISADVVLYSLEQVTLWFDARVVSAGPQGKGAPILLSVIMNCAGSSEVGPVFVIVKLYVMVWSAAPYVCELAVLDNVNMLEGCGAVPRFSVSVAWFDVTFPAVAVALLTIDPVVTSD